VTPVDNQTQSAIGWVLTFIVTLPVSAAGALYLLSMSWLAYGILGSILGGVAGALAIAAPYSAYGFYQCRQGNEGFIKA